MIEKVEAVVKRMRWKLYWFSNNNDNSSEEYKSEYFGLKSKNTPPASSELEDFENDMLEMVRNIKFDNKYSDPFQRKLKADISKIRNSKDVYIFADKTTNIYTMPPEKYNKLLKENVTQTYKKAPIKREKSINLEAKSIANNYGIDKRAECLANNQAFITLKDHKPNFNTKLPCRLINPCKSELGAISKTILDRVNKEIREKLKLNQWKNTTEVIDWFKSVSNKHECRFVQMDIKEFYPAITKDTLTQALNFAQKHTTITNEDVRTIFHCRKSLLIFDKVTWNKKTSDDCFDVTMGSYDGAEICDLVGLFILSNLSELLEKRDIGLYRDDGLMILRNKRGRATDKVRKDVIQVFKNNNFQIEIETGLKIVNFLDVTLNLNNNTYQPYKKPNDTLLYVHTSSNHPKQIIKQIPKSINERLQNHSSNKKVFDKTKQEFEESLKNSGFTDVNFEFDKTTKTKTQRNRSRNIIWFNPPFNKNVSTNVAGQFLSLINKHFPTKHKLHKLFNRNNVKVSYSCTENVKKIIQSHNKRITSDVPTETVTCNCRVKDNCPLNGKCLTKSIIYKCDVTAPEIGKKSYIGLTEGEWKTRYNNHKQSFKHRKHSKSTTLSAYIWKLKDEFSITPTLSWSIVKKVPSYSNITKKCNLCLYEKFAILTHQNQEELLNKRSEIISKCRHENKFLLANFKSND